GPVAVDTRPHRAGVVRHANRLRGVDRCRARPCRRRAVDRRAGRGCDRCCRRDAWRRRRARAAGSRVRARSSGGAGRGCGGDRRCAADRDGGGMNRARRFDAIIVGAGQAGPPLAGRLTQAGRSVALVERKLFGGTCVNTGCMPTKTLVASARAAHMARRAADFGVLLDGAVRVDMAKVKSRADTVIANARRGVREWLDGMDGCTVVEGHARFEDPGTLRVGDERMSAPQVFLDVGGRAATPDIPGLDTIPWLSNTSILALDRVPRHLLVVGGSYIGLEYAQMHRRFGAGVTVVEAGPRVIGREDEDVSAAVREILEAEGLDMRTGLGDSAFARDGEAISATIDGDRISCSHVLVATGRVPNTADLGLDKAGVDVDERGYIVVDDELRTSAPGVWALGDCNGRGAFTHTAYND